MKTYYLVAIFVFFITGCATEPAFVYHLADQEYEKISGKKGIQNRNDFIADYSYGFFKGFTKPMSGFNSRSEATMLGYIPGKKLALDKNTDYKKIMSMYGFAYVELYGSWSTGSEHSGFTPINSKGQNYWLEQLWNCECTYSSDDWLNNESRVVLVKGYLSKPGKYGHLDIYRKIIYATYISD